MVPYCRINLAKKLNLDPLEGVPKDNSSWFLWKKMDKCVFIPVLLLYSLWFSSKFLGFSHGFSSFFKVIFPVLVPRSFVSSTASIALTVGVIRPEGFE